MRHKIIYGLLVMALALSPALALAHNSEAGDDGIGFKLQQRLDNLEQMFDLRIDWLTDIIERLESRVSKLEASGVETNSAEATLAAARVDLKVASEKIPGLMYKIHQTLETETTRRAFAPVKTEIKTLSDEIKAVHRQLVMVISELKRAAALHNKDSNDRDNSN